MCDGCHAWLHCGSEAPHEEHEWVYYDPEDGSGGDVVRCVGTLAQEECGRVDAHYAHPWTTGDDTVSDCPGIYPDTSVVDDESEDELRKFEVLWTLYSEDPATGQIGRTVALVEDGYTTVADIPKMIAIITGVPASEINLVACIPV